MPASPSPDTVTDNDEKRAADSEQQALHKLEEATQKRDSISHERDTTAERAGSHTPEALESLCAQKQQYLDELAAKADRLAALSTELAAVEAQLEASQQQLNSAQSEVATLHERHGHLRTALRRPGRHGRGLCQLPHLRPAPQPLPRGGRRQ